MCKKIIAIIILAIASLANPANAIYFPDGIDWTNPSADRFVMSLYLNMLGKAPDNREIRTATAQLRPADSRENRLRVFLQVVKTSQYQRLFSDTDRSWRIYRAPDYNHDGGKNTWRYEAAAFQPEGFQQMRSTDPYTQQIARAIARHYNAFCYSGQPCVSDPIIARNRGTEATTGSTFTQAHACADPANQDSQFEWAATNGTTYPRGIDERIVCMGQHYYEAIELNLQRYQCDPGYLNCRRDPAMDLRGQRSGKDNQGHPAIFFSDGSRLSLTSSKTYNNGQQQSKPTTRSQTRPAARAHACANPQRTTSRFQWKGPNGTSISRGVDNSVVCMDDHFYRVDGITLQHYQCAAGFTDCQHQPSRDLRAERRLRVAGAPGLEFSNGTTLTLIKRSAESGTVKNSATDKPVPQPRVQQQTRRGEHDCANPSRRISQFRWTKQNGTTSWPDGIDGRVVCQADAYYVIDGITLHHHQCSSGFMNCRANPRNDLIALQDSEDQSGYRTLVFANGDKLSLISR